MMLLLQIPYGWHKNNYDTEYPESCYFTDIMDDLNGLYDFKYRLAFFFIEVLFLYLNVLEVDECLFLMNEVYDWLKIFYTTWEPLCIT